MPINRRKVWHPEDIKAAVRKRGTTLADLARQAGLQTHACQNALKQPHSYGEAVIARFLDIPAATLWPDRYDSDGNRLHGTRISTKCKPRRAPGHGQNEVAA